MAKKLTLKKKQIMQQEILLQNSQNGKTDYTD